jgi:hypothetical protein
MILWIKGRRNKRRRKRKGKRIEGRGEGGACDGKNKKL